MDKDAIINSIKDENGYININLLYEKLLANNFNEEEILLIVKEVSISNKSIISNIKKENSELISNQKNKNAIFRKNNNYEVGIFKEEEIKTNAIKKYANYENVDFYIGYIKENSDKDSIINILPNENTISNIRVIDSILVNYLEEINLLKYFIETECSGDEIEKYTDELMIVKEIFDIILHHKEYLLTKDIVNNNDTKKIKNEVLYFKNGEIPYMYIDIINNPESYDSFKVLYKSIEDGSFKGLKFFTNNDRLKGLVEVRDLTNCTRIIFDILGNKKYCIIGALTNKKDTNSIYKEWINNRYKKYLSQKNNIVSDKDNDMVKKLIMEENNG